MQLISVYTMDQLHGQGSFWVLYGERAMQFGSKKVEIRFPWVLKCTGDTKVSNSGSCMALWCTRRS